MQRVTRSSAVPVMPAPPASPGPAGWFTQGNPGSGIPATVPGYEWFNGVQAELIELITRSGLTPDAAVLTQVRQSLDRLYGGGVTTVSANVTLTAAEAGLVVVDASGGSRTITLPAASSANGRPILFRIVRSDATANTVTVQRAGADVLRGGATSLTMARASAITLQSDGVSVWDTLGEHARGRSIGTNGWIAHPGGLIQQWGSASLTSASAAVGGFSILSAITFPLAFPTACLNAIAITQTPGSSTGGTNEEHELKLTISAVSPTQLTLAAQRLVGSFAAGDTVGILWQAIGW